MPSIIFMITLLLAAADSSRQRRFVENLNPILDEMRSVKSPREIAMVRRASQIAGLGLMEAMGSTESGVTEYQLDAAARCDRGQRHVRDTAQTMVSSSRNLS